MDEFDAPLGDGEEGPAADADAPEPVSTAPPTPSPPPQGRAPVDPATVAPGFPLVDPLAAERNVALAEEASILPIHTANARFSGIRSQAALIFITSPKGLSVADLALLPSFAGVGEARLRAWASADHWTAQRTAFLQRVDTRVYQGSIDRMSKMRLDEIAWNERIMGSIDHALARADDEGRPVLQPKSFKEAVWLRMQLGQRQELLAGAETAALERQALLDAAGTGQADLTPEEEEAAARAGAEAVRRLRQERENAAAKADGGEVIDLVRPAEDAPS